MKQFYALNSIFPAASLCVGLLWGVSSTAFAQSVCETRQQCQTLERRAEDRRSDLGQNGSPERETRGARVQILIDADEIHQYAGTAECLEAGKRLPNIRELALKIHPQGVSDEPRAGFQPVVYRDRTITGELSEVKRFYFKGTPARDGTPRTHEMRYLWSSSHPVAANGDPNDNTQTRAFLMHRYGNFIQPAGRDLTESSGYSYLKYAVSCVEAR